jgi:hypothetical protein
MPVPQDLGAGVQMLDANVLDAIFTLFSNGGGFSTTTGITAHAGGGQASGVALTAAINHVGTVASAADSVCLPSAVGGQAITVMNAGGNALAVFSSNSSTADTINGTAGTTAFSVPTGKTAEFISYQAGAWRTILSA